MPIGSNEPFHSDACVFKGVVEMTKMGRERPIERIAKSPHDYKHCNRCGKINRYKNKYCIGCGHKDFNPMNDEYGKRLLLDWEKEPDLPLEV